MMSSSPLAVFPALPRASQTTRSPHVYEAVELVSQHVESAQSLLNQEAEFELSELAVCSDGLEFQTIPLLQALVDSAEEEEIPQDWIQASIDILLDLIVSLKKVQQSHAPGNGANASVRVEHADRSRRGISKPSKAKLIQPRKVYTNPRPNAMWHVDGHHKLNPWGFVIHGFIDGFCRTVVGLRASDNNRAATVVDLFLQATEEYGEPSRVRGDRGGENKGVAVCMNAMRGLHRGSFIWGTSTHNTRIERLWGEVGECFARAWRAFFLRLERLHQLDRKNLHHLWIIHRLFLDLLNDDCHEFVQMWNAHPISGKGHDQSPQDLRLFGRLKHGVYLPSQEDARLDIEAIKAEYGIGGQPSASRSPGTPGPADADSSLDNGTDLPLEAEDEWEALEMEFDSEFNRKPVSASRFQNPFTSPEQELAFFATLKELRDEQLIPEGYGIRPEEWEDGEYPSFGTIQCGKIRNYRVQLPDHIWRPRAVHWVQALHVYNYMSNV